MLLLLVFTLSTLNAELSPIPRADVWTTDGSIKVLVITNGVAYVGGSFTSVGIPSRGLAGLDPLTGSLRRALPPVHGIVNCIVPDGQGGLVVAGNFERIGTLTTQNLARLLPDGSVDTNFAFSIDAPVSCVAVKGSQLFLGGRFNSVNGLQRTSLAEVNLTTAALTPLQVDVSGGVLTMELAGSRLFLGGDFTRVGTSNRLCLAALDLENGAVTSWSADCGPWALYSGVPRVHQLALDGDRLLAAGYFGTINDVERRGVAALDIQSGSVLGWNPILNSDSGTPGVERLAVSQDTVYLGGRFDRISGESRTNLGAVRRDTGEPLPWRADQPFSTVASLVIQGDAIYVAGWFRESDYTTIPRLAGFDATTGAMRPFQSSGSQRVTTMFFRDDVLWVGGSFTVIGGSPRENLAAIDLRTGMATDWHPSAPNGEVTHLLLGPSSILAAGSFTTLNGEPRPRFGALGLVHGETLPLNTTNWVDPFWEISCALDSGATQLLVRQLSGSRVVLDTSTGAVTPWNPVPPGQFRSAVSDGRTLFVSGLFDAINGRPRSFLAAYDLATRTLSDWAPRLDAPARLFCFDQQILAAGSFTKANGQPRDGMALLDARTGILNPLQIPLQGTLRGVSFSENRIYLSGDLILHEEPGQAFFVAVDRRTGAVQQLIPEDQRLLLHSSSEGGFVSAFSEEGLLIAGQFNCPGGGYWDMQSLFPVAYPPPRIRVAANDPVVFHLSSTPASIPLAALALPDAIVRTELLVNGEVVGSSIGLPQFMTWEPAPRRGSYLVNAVAYDARGEFAISPAARLLVLPPQDYVEPSIQFLSPTNGGVYPHDSPMVLSPALVDPSQGITNVSVWIRSNQVAQLSEPPFLFVTNLPPATYTATVSIQDRYGLDLTNGPVTFRINRPPSCTLSAPPSVVFAGSTFVFNATAKDLDGTIRRVEFYANGDLVGVALAPFYVARLTNLVEGFYEATALAVDDFGAVTVAPSIAFEAIRPRPANDSFLGPIPLSGTAPSGAADNTSATSERSDPDLSAYSPSKKTMWWAWTAAWTGTATVSTRGSSFDTLLGVYTGSVVLRNLGVSDDTSPSDKTSTVNFQAFKDTTYYFLVDGQHGGSGPALISVAPIIQLSRVAEGAGEKVHVTGTGPAWVGLTLERSSDLRSWTPVGTGSPDSTTFDFTDPSPGAGNAAFYRVRMD